MESSVEVAPDPSSNSVRSQRFTDWVVLFVFSVIALGSAVETAHDSDYSGNSQRWIVAMSALSFLLSLGAICFQLSGTFSSLFIGTRLEGGMLGFLILGWIGGVAVMSDSNNDLAVNEEGRVQNGNLYYFSWAAFVWSVTLFANYLRSVYSIDVVGETQNRAKRLTMWSSMLVISIIIMSNCAQIYHSSCAGDDAIHDGGSFFCATAMMGTSFGTLCTVLCLQICLVKIHDQSHVPAVSEALMVGIVLTLYTIGVALLTSDKGPAAPLGNLYYASWAAFLVSLMLAKSCFEDVQLAKSMQNQNDGANGDLAMQETSVGHESNNLSFAPANSSDGDDHI